VKGKRYRVEATVKVYLDCEVTDDGLTDLADQFYEAIDNHEDFPRFVDTEVEWDYMEIKE